LTTNAWVVADGMTVLSFHASGPYCVCIDKCIWVKAKQIKFLLLLYTLSTRQRNTALLSHQWSKVCSQ